jgi:hypothetical protein
MERPADTGRAGGHRAVNALGRPTAGHTNVPKDEEIIMKTRQLWTLLLAATFVGGLASLGGCVHADVDGDNNGRGTGGTPAKVEIHEHHDDAPARDRDRDSVNVRTDVHRD